MCVGCVGGCVECCLNCGVCFFGVDGEDLSFGGGRVEDVEVDDGEVDDGCELFEEWDGVEYDYFML